MSTIDCAGFVRWLDEGADPEFEGAMRAHAADCAACGEAFTAMGAVDAWLAAAPAAPRGFADAVMARIERRAPEPIAVDEMPWWVGVLQQPVVGLAAAVAALVLWKANALIAMALAGAAQLSTWAGAFGGTTLAWTARLAWVPATPANAAAQNVVLIAWALGLAPLLALGSLALTGWVTRLAARRALAA